MCVCVIYVLTGKLMGSAARAGNYLELSLSPMVWKLIVDQEVTMDDYRGVDILGAKFIESLRHFDKPDEFSCYYEDYDFSVITLGGSTAELHPGGLQTSLTMENRDAYCDELLSYRLREMKAAATAIRAGLATQLPPAILALIKGEELERLVCGNPNVDIGLLKSATDYSGYSEGDEVVKWFWEIMSEFSTEERKAYLKFTWGRSRLPTSRSNFTQKMKITKLERSSPDGYLPVSHTCFFSIDLPK